MRNFIILFFLTLPIASSAQEFKILCTSEYLSTSEYLPDHFTFNGELKVEESINKDIFFTYLEISEDDYLDLVIQCPTGTSPQPALANSSTFNLFRVENNSKSYWSPGKVTYFNRLVQTNTRRYPDHIFLRFSDSRVKEDVSLFSTSLKETLKLDSYEYRYINTPKKELGLIAQQVEDIYPNIVFVDKNSGLKQIDYKGMIPILLESIRELNDKVTALESTKNKKPNTPWGTNGLE